MQHLEVSCAVRPIKWPLGVKWLKFFYSCMMDVKRTIISVPKFKKIERHYYYYYY